MNTPLRSIDREGIFKVRPREWWVRKADSNAVAVSFDFDILEQHNGTDWDSWAEYEQHTVFGDYWVVKKDGTINTAVVEQLAASIGWDGNLSAVQDTPPNVVAQITVKAETYEGKTRFKAGWMNPENFTPGPAGAAPEEVNQLQSQFGSLLRAAAAGAGGNGAPATTAPAAAPTSTSEPPPPGDDDRPPA